MVNCPNCGSPQNEKAVYCGVCGSILKKKPRPFSKLSLICFLITIFTMVSLAVFRYTVVDKIYFVVLGVVAVVITGALILSIISLVSSKKEKKSGWQFGLVSLIISACVMSVYLLFALAWVLVSIPSSSGSTKTKTTEPYMNFGSAVISGTPRFFGKEITLPCTVGELKELGFDTDYDLVGDEMKIWPKDGRDSPYSGPYFDCYLEFNSYNSRTDKATNQSVVVAIQFQKHNQVDFDFHNISLDMTEYDVIDAFGYPAFEHDPEMDGHKSYYWGDNGCVYRFNYMYSNSRGYYESEEEKDRRTWRIMYATEEYALAHGKNS